MGRRGVTVWFTGLSGAGKTTLSCGVAQQLQALALPVEVLDGDLVRQHLTKGLGFGKEDRDENVRRIGFVAEMLTRHGVIVLVSAISPYRATRQEVRQRIGNFIEVFVDAPWRCASSAMSRASTAKRGQGSSSTLPASTIPTSHQNARRWCAKPLSEASPSVLSW